MATRRPKELQGFPAELRENVRWGTRPLAVRYVIDGDSFGGIMDAGCAEYRFVTVRIAGIDAPERASPPGVDAWNALAAMLPEGAPVVLGTRGVDAYGRIVADVLAARANGDAYDVATQLVVEGHAKWTDGG